MEIAEEEVLEQMEEVEFEIDQSAFQVEEASCPTCNIKMDKVIENKDLFDGAVTIHIIQFQCSKCKKVFLDLEQAKKQELFLKLERLSQKQSLEYLNHCLSNGGMQKVTA